METTLSTDHQLWHVTLSLPGIIDLCFLCFVLRQKGFKVRSLIKILVYVSITHHQITLSHTHTPLETRYCLKWCVDPRFVGRCPIRPLPSIYLWPAVRRGEGPLSYISKQQQLAQFNQSNSQRLYRGHCPTHIHRRSAQCQVNGWGGIDSYTTLTKSAPIAISPFTSFINQGDVRRGELRARARRDNKGQCTTVWSRPGNGWHSIFVTHVNSKCTSMYVCVY